MAIAMMKEDMWCPTPIIGLGLACPPQYYLDGRNHYPDSAESLEAGASLAQGVPRFEVGKYVGVLSAPLSSASFEPDIILTYCNSLQLMRLLQCAAYREGRDVRSQLSGGAACVYAIVPSVQTGEFYVSIPCDGDRRRAGAQDDEIIFTIPIAKLDNLVLGLRKRAGKMPLTPNMVMQYKLSPSAANIAKSLGMKKSDDSEIEGYADRLPHE
jgi:uncharacterized protein (DUF169 family)